LTPTVSSGGVLANNIVQEILVLLGQ